MELRHYLNIVWKWLWVVVLTTVVAASLSYIVTSQQPKMYQAEVKLVVGQSISSTLPNSQDMQTSQSLALTYIQIAKTTPVLQETLDALGLKWPTGALADRFTASLIVGTQLLDIRVDDTEPARAQLIANELAHQLVLQAPAAQQDPAEREFQKRQAADLQSKISDAQKEVADLRSSMQVTLSARDIAAKQQQVTSLEAQINQWQVTYTGMQAVMSPRSPNYLAVIDPAQMPGRPFAPNVALNVVLAAMIGLILSISAIVIIEYLDDTIKSPDDVTRALQVPTLAALGRLGPRKAHWWRKPVAPTWTTAQLPTVSSNGDNGDNAHAEIEPSISLDRVDHHLITVLAPRSSDAEPFRVLRSNIRFSGVDKPIRSIVVTSPQLNEGKSTTAANLAVVMAQAGLRTILIDCDLHRPTQHMLFGLLNDGGLTNSLIQNDPIGALQRSPLETLRIITSGPLPPNPAELVGSARMRALKATLEQEADMLILDCPPCLPVTDTALLSQLCDGVVLVIDVTRTGRKEAVRSKETLQRAGARILGVALNRVDPRRNDYYYYRAYSRTSSTGRNKHPGHKVVSSSNHKPRIHSNG